MAQAMFDRGTRLAAADVLRRARGEIERRGWMQGAASARAYCDPDARCCLGVALALAERSWNPVADAAWTFIRVRTGPLITGWNDELGRTAGEVLAAIDGAIADLESEPV